MERHVSVTVTSRSRYEGGSERMVFRGSGLLRKTEEGYHLRYTAAHADGSRVASDVRLEGGIARVRNIGADYTLVLDPAGRTESRIPTEAGVIAMEVVTERLDWSVEDKGGTIHMSYTLMALGRTLSRLQLTVELRDK